jgi:hypothetical protein
MGWVKFVGRVMWRSPVIQPTILRPELWDGLRWKELCSASDVHSEPTSQDAKPRV